MTVGENVAAGGMAMLLQLVALYGAKQLRGTTLMVPCLWVATAASCLLLLAVAQVQFANGLAISVLRFAVAAMTLCPTVAVLGAKRPQDRGWQWVVAALWLVVVWPAAQTLANPAGPDFEIFVAWKIFIVALIAISPLNYLPTRHWLASMLVAGGQVVLFSRFLGINEPDYWFPAAVTCLWLAAMLVMMRRQARVPGDAALPDQTASWLWFRDAYGAFWGLRIMQRVNETAALRDWPVQLAWSGIEKVKVEAITEAHAAEIDQALGTLLRRFL
jgi:hypothetical protein